MSGTEIRSIAGFVFLGFAGTLLLHWSQVAQWWNRQPPHAHAPAARVFAPSPGAAAAAPVPAAFGLQLPPAAGAEPRRAEEQAESAAIEVPPAPGADAPALPVMLAIHSEGDKEIDFVNTSDEPLTVTVLVADAPRAQVFLRPRAEEHLAAGPGLGLDPGMNVTLRAPPYKDLTQTVR